MFLVRWLLENGVGQNLTAGALVFALGFLWSKTKYWPLHTIHAHLEALRESHASLAQTERQLHAHLVAIRESHARLTEHHARALRSDERLHVRLDRLEELLTENGDGSPKPPPARRASKAKTPPSPASRRTRRPPKA